MVIRPRSESAVLVVFTAADLRTIELEPLTLEREHVIVARGRESINP